MSAAAGGGANQTRLLGVDGVPGQVDGLERSAGAGYVVGLSSSSSAGRSSSSSLLAPALPADGRTAVK